MRPLLILRGDVKRSLLLLALLGAVLSSAAEAQQPYVEPAIRTLTRPGMLGLLESVSEPPPDARPAEPPQAGSFVVDQRGPGGTLRLELIIRIRDSRGLDDIRAAGGEVGLVHDGLVTARVPIANLPELSRSPRIEKIQASRYVTVTHDSSMVAIRAHEVRVRDAFGWSGLTGRGVIVGVFDTGIDYRHEDFRHPDGYSRLLGLWDQTRSGTPPPGFFSGEYCPPSALDAEACLQQDRSGHGTHVAGSAAGSGAATGATGTAFQYAGVAPEADLLVVKGGDGSFPSSNIRTGVRWMMEEAGRLGRPIVVNLSLGGQFGPRDGTTNIERELSGLTGPGRIIVAAVGNEGSNVTHPAFGVHLFHAMGVPVPNATGVFEIQVPAYSPTAGSCNDAFALEMWAPAGSRLTITVRRPDGSALSAPFGVAVEERHPSGGISIDNASAGADPDNGDFESWIQVDDCGDAAPPQQGAWRIEITETTGTTTRPYHLWIDGRFRLGQWQPRGAAGFDNRYIPGWPASADDLIAVGAFTTRTSWPSVAGNQQAGNREETGDIAYFSSPGPRRDEVLKPEISAPGRVIMSALSRHATVPDQLVAPTRAHYVAQGTSMASPHVAGAVALLLQARPSLTPDQIRSVLMQTALRDEFTSRYYPFGPRTFEPAPNPLWGAGKLDVRAAVDALGLSPAEPVMLRIEPRGGTLQPGDSLQLRATVLNVLRDTLPLAPTWTSRDPGVASVDAQGMVRALAGGSTWIVASADGRADSVRVVVVVPATLVVRARALPVTAEVPGGTGAAVSLLALDLSVLGSEPIDLLQLGFRVSGSDAAARIILARSPTGEYRAGDAVVADTVLALQPGQPVDLIFRMMVRVQPGETLTLVLAIQPSGWAPHGASFEAIYLPDQTRTRGALSGVENRIDAPAGPVVSEESEVTVLRPDEVFNLTQNPIRTAPVIMSFRERPSIAAVYTLAGRRVVDLTTRLEPGGTRLEWDLRNDAGARIAPGVYLAVFRIGETTLRERLFVTAER
jgi:subtilisin family serine protease